MVDYEQPAIQNSTQACFHCKSKLTDVTPLEAWEVNTGERYIKVKCSNEQCGSFAWRPDTTKRDNKVKN